MQPNARAPKQRLLPLALLMFLHAACASDQPATNPTGGAGTSGGTGGTSGGTRGGQAGTTGTGASGAAGTTGMAGGAGTSAAGTTGGGAAGSASGGGAGTAMAGEGGRGGVGARAGMGGGNVGGAGAGGRGGSAAAGGGGAGATTGSGGAAGAAGLGGPSLCTPGKYIICEDFEATAVGAVPTGWTKHGNAAVASDQAARGAHSLKISAADSGERRIYTTDTTKLGSGHWGRIFYRVQLPAPPAFVHSTMVALYGNGPVNGAEEVRVVDTVKNADSGNTPGKHQFLYNVQPSGSEFGTGSAYNYSFDGAWHCAEWHIDNPTQSYHFYYDGVEVTSIAINNGAGKYTGSDIPPVFSQARVGWNNYQSAPPGFVAWVDEIAMDTNRIGCGN